MPGASGDCAAEMDPVEAALWRRWRIDADAAAREELLALHLPYARVVAASYFGRRLSGEIDFDDYLQIARLGLMEALDRFDPGRGVQFRTFAARRMHGALVDGLERMTEKQQQVAASRRLRERAESIAAAPVPSTQDAPEQLLRYVAEVGLAFALGWMLEGTELVRAEEEPRQEIPFYRTSQLRERRLRLRELVDTLPEQECRVVRAHYFQQQSFEEIARSMRLSRGRISQVHRKALATLAREMLLRDIDVAW